MQHYYINNYNTGIARDEKFAIFELSPNDNKKSFYGKCKVIETAAGRYLQSYNTIICFISYGGTFVKLWDGYSATTMRHINAFMEFIRWNECGGKAWWDRLEVKKEYSREDMKNGSR